MDLTVEVVVTIVHPTAINEGVYHGLGCIFYEGSAQSVFMCWYRRCEGQRTIDERYQTQLSLAHGKVS